jgi:hypothetical protein
MNLGSWESSVTWSCEIVIGEEVSGATGLRRNFEPPRVKGVTGVLSNISISFIVVLSGREEFLVDGGDDNTPAPRAVSYWDKNWRRSRTRFVGESTLSTSTGINYLVADYSMGAED